MNDTLWLIKDSFSVDLALENIVNNLNEFVNESIISKKLNDKKELPRKARKA